MPIGSSGKGGVKGAQEDSSMLLVPNEGARGRAVRVDSVGKW
jgi:hypothetical protein